MAPEKGPSEVPEERTEALVRRVRSGGSESFGNLYARVAPALFAWANLRVRPALRARLDPEDLVQEICCRAYESFGRYDPARGGFRQWVFGIANHVLQGALTALTSGPRPAAGAPSEGATRRLDQLPDDATRASRLAARSDSLAVFLGAAAALGEDERKLLVYRGLEGLSLAEVAPLLGVNEETAKKRWQRLRQRLAEMKAPEELW